MTTYDIRKRLGDRHEEHVAEALRTRGWRVAPYGMGTQRPIHRAMIHASGSPLRFEPDLMISPENAPQRVQLIDCKAQFNTAENYLAVNEECVRAQLTFMAATQLPIWYVFSDLSVSTPNEVLAFGRKSAPAPGGSWHFRIPRLLNREFDSIFGAVPFEQLRLAEPLAA
ncbi:hypothetical protein ACFVH6_21945 [Spirillospora sp. NPDC127200]